MKLSGFCAASKVDEPKDDHHEEFKERSVASQAIETESEIEESENDSSGLIVGGPNAYLR